MRALTVSIEVEELRGKAM